MSRDFTSRNTVFPLVKMEIEHFSTQFLEKLKNKMPNKIPHNLDRQHLSCKGDRTLDSGSNGI